MTQVSPDASGKSRALLRVASRGGRRLGGFTVSTAMLAAASLVLMPATIHAAGLETWSSIVLAQALAQIVTFVGGYGYGLNGPSRVAEMSRTEGVRFYFVTQRTRLLVSIPCFALAIAAMFIVRNPDPVAGLLGAAPLGLATFSASFYFVGRAAPMWLLGADTIPRAVFMFAGAAVMALGGPLVVGLGLATLGAGLAVIISNLTIRSSIPTGNTFDPIELTDVRSELRVQLHPLVSTVLRGGALALPVLLVTAVASQLVGAFGVYDRVRRQALAALAPVTLTLQGWVPRRLARDRSARSAVVALFVGILAGFGTTVGFAVVGRPIIEWLSAGQLAPSQETVLLCGAVIGTSVIVQVCDLACLVPLRAARGVLAGNLVGIVAVSISIPMFLLAGQSVGFALCAVIVGNLVQFCVQLFVFVFAVRGFRRMPGRDESARRLSTNS